MRYSMRRRGNEAAVARQCRLNLLTRVPVDFGHLGFVDGKFLAIGMAVAADHQLARKRPGLARDIGYIAHLHARFFQHLPRDSLLNALTRLDKTGECRKAALGPAEWSTYRAAFVATNTTYRSAFECP